MEKPGKTYTRSQGHYEFQMHLHMKLTCLRTFSNHIQCNCLTYMRTFSNYIQYYSVTAFRKRDKSISFNIQIRKS